MSVQPLHPLERDDAGSRPDAEPPGRPDAGVLRFPASPSWEILCRTLMAGLADRIFFKDRRSVFLAVNHTFAADFEQPPEAFVGKTDYDFFPPDLAGKYQADDQRVMAQKRAEVIEEVNLAAGHMRIVEVTKTPVLGPEGEVLGLLGIFKDITAQRQAEKELKRSQKFLHSVVENLPITVFIKTADELRFVLWNKAGEALTGRPREALIGKTDYDVFAKEDADFYTAKDRETLRSGTLLDIPEETLRTASGRTRILHTRKIPILDDDGKPLYLLGISEDVTAAKLAEQQLKDFAARLEQNNRELQEFAYVASHDLQEPLRKVQAFGDRLKARCADQLGEQGRDYLERMQNAARRMQVLIEDLLAYSRVTTRAQPFVPTDLTAVVREVVSDLEVRIEQTGARIHVDPLPTIEADPTQMRQLFQNLLGNALKFHRPGVAPEIRVSAQVADGAGARRKKGSLERGFCRIEVEDNGIGFDEKYLDRIFNVFQRLHGRSEYEGNGVGLAVCRKIVVRHGGEITARSRPGHGATFIVTLPLQQTKLEALP